MGYSKRQFVTQAFEEIGLAGYVFDLTPEQLNSALTRLDAMMATWNGLGIRLGYPIPGSPENSDIDAETGVPDSANEAIYTNLGIRIAPAYGKAVSQETKVLAKQAYNVLLMRANPPMEMQLPGTMPIGAGNKPRMSSSNYMPPPSNPILVGPDGPLEFN